MQPEMPWKNPVRNYKYIDQHLNELLDDVYDQPPDAVHTALALTVLDKWISKISMCRSVLDVGCGEAFLQEHFENLDIEYAGVCLGNDYVKAKELGRNVERHDFNFLPYKDESFDLIFARHALEHSVMPIITLMEWHRIAKNWLCLIMPKPKFWTFVGRNHYSVMALSQCRFLLQRSGWKVMWEDHSHIFEYRFMCEKVHRVFNQEVKAVMYETDDLTWLDEAEEDEYEEIDLTPKKEEKLHGEV